MSDKEFPKVTFSIPRGTTLKGFLKSLAVDGNDSVQFISWLLYLSESSRKYVFEGGFGGAYSLHELAPFLGSIHDLLHGKDVFIENKMISPSTIVKIKL